MHKKPKIILLFGSVLILEPLMIIFLHLINAENFMNTLSASFSLGLEDIYWFWLVTPLSGLALIAFKSWSLPVFLTLQLTYFLHLYNHKALMMAPFVASKFLAIVFILFHLFVLIYVFCPKFRNPFFNKKMRWWEPAKRFQLNIACYATWIDSDEYLDCKILNISQTGAFIKTNPNFYPIGSKMRMKFSFHKRNFDLWGYVRAHHHVNSKQGVGVQFEIDSVRDKLNMYKLHRALHILVGS